MFTNQGIAVNAWVTVDGDCSLSCDVIGDQAQFEFGTSTGSLNLIASETGLARLATVANDALTRLRDMPPGQEVSLTVVPPVA